jgi:hypothetical protein
LQKTPLFAKMLIFTKMPIFSKRQFLSIFCKNANFCKSHFLSIFREKRRFFVKKITKMLIFAKKQIFAKSFGEFRGNPIRFLQKSCFSARKLIFAKNILQLFLQCPPHYPHGVRGSNHAF